MKKSNLDNFEFGLPTKVWDTAQDLMAAGAVKSLQEGEKGYWTAIVADTASNSLEVELLLSGKTIKSFSCDCWTEKRLIPCVHVAATLAQVRNFLQHAQTERAQKSEAAKKDQSPNSRLTVQKMLLYVPTDSLLEWLIVYSKTDKNFATALKTQFIGNLADDIGGVAFKQLLNGILPETPVSHKLWSRPIFVRLLKSLTELTEQATEAIEAGDYRRATDILLPLLRSTEVFVRHVSHTQHYESEAFMAVLGRTFTRLNGVSLPHEIREEITDSLLEIILSNKLRIDLLSELCGILAQRSIGTPLYARIEKQFLQTQAPIPRSLTLLYSSAMVANGLQEKVPNVFSAGKLTELDMMDFCRRMVGMGFDLGATHVLYLLYASGVIPVAYGYRGRVFDTLIQASTRLEKADFLLPILIENFQKRPYISYLPDLKAKSGRKWNTVMARLLNHFEAEKKYSGMFMIHLFENNLTAAEEIMFKYPDPTVTHPCVLYLVENNLEWLEKAYIRLFLAYLQVHFGYPATRFITQTLNPFFNMQHIGMLQRIVKGILDVKGRGTHFEKELLSSIPIILRRYVIP